MIEFYPAIKQVHVYSAVLLMAMFVLRAVFILLWPKSRAKTFVVIMMLSLYTSILSTALILFSILPAAVFANHWLEMKISLLAAHELLMAIAKKHQGRARIVYLAASALLLLCVYITARDHHPLAVWRLFSV